jgi:hypothetical protein
MHASYHEAGHCVAAIALDLPVLSIAVTETGGGTFRSSQPKAIQSLAEESRTHATIVEDWKQQGVSNSDKRYLARLAVMICAGPVSGFRSSGTLDGADTDFDHLRQLLGLLFDDKDQQFDALRVALTKAEEIVDRNWDAIFALAANVFFENELDEAEIRRALHGRVRLMTVDSLIEPTLHSERRLAPFSRPVVDGRTGRVLGGVEIRPDGMFRAFVRGGGSEVFGSAEAAKAYCARHAPPDPGLHYSTTGYLRANPRAA